MITKVRLKNWKSHLDSEFDFTFGTNALLGRMGAGKSSCLDAICFALFGSFPSLQSKKIKIDDIIMKKPQEKDKAEVEVNFDLDGSFFSVKRVIEKRKGTTYSEIRENGKLLINSVHAQPGAPADRQVALKIRERIEDLADFLGAKVVEYTARVPKAWRSSLR